MSDTREMPRYKCHKEVHALEIKKVEPLAESTSGRKLKPTGYRLHFVEDGYGPMDVAASMMVRYVAQVGDYYVVYKDGYDAISPKAAFEDGYVLADPS